MLSAMGSTGRKNEMACFVFFVFFIFSSRIFFCTGVIAALLKRGPWSPLTTSLFADMSVCTGGRECAADGSSGFLNSPTASGASSVFVRFATGSSESSSPSRERTTPCALERSESPLIVGGKGLDSKPRVVFSTGTVAGTGAAESIFVSAASAVAPGPAGVVSDVLPSDGTCALLSASDATLTGAISVDGITAGSASVTADAETGTAFDMGSVASWPLGSERPASGIATSFSPITT